MMSSICSASMVSHSSSAGGHRFRPCRGFPSAAFGQGVLLVDDAADFGIDLLHGDFRKRSCESSPSGREDLTVVLAVDHGPRASDMP